MKTIKEALNDGILPQDAECIVKDNRYYIGTVGYPLTMKLSILKKALVERKKLAPDFKAISHALRAAYQLLEIYETGDLKYPLKYREFVLAVKQGKLDFTATVQPALEDVIAKVERLAAIVVLPESVNRKYWEQFIVNVYNGYYDYTEHKESLTAK